MRKTVSQHFKPLFSNKVKATTTIKLVENNKMMVAKLLNEYFVNIVKKLGIFTKVQSAVSTENSQSEVEIAIAKFRNHPSINAITEKMERLGNTTFGFDFTLYEETFQEVKSLKGRKVSQKTDIPVKTVKENIYIVISCIIILITHCHVLPFSLV